MILGIDEVGRGPWAGPLVVGAVVLGEATIEGLTDSKKLSARRREELDSLIREQALAWGLGWVHAEELDEIGLAAALRLATIRAVESIDAPYHEIIIDGTINFLKETGKGRFVTTLAKADLLIPSVSAASIIAKVARDAFMAEQDDIYPGYSFGKHVGYGTAAHRQAIDRLGVTPLHRKSFAPIAASMSSHPKTAGQEGEDSAVVFLRDKGFTIRERNWRTKWCEIDIVAEKDGVTYFVEVKYRRSTAQGGGIGAITPEKQRRMQRGAELYAVKHAVGDHRLAVTAIDGTIVTFLEIE